MSSKTIVRGNNNVTGSSNVIGNNNVVGNNNVLSTQDKTDLQQSLQRFQEELAKLKLPEGKFTVANGDLTAAIDESKKPQPDNKKIESRFNNVIETIREAGKTETVSKWDTTKKILTILGKIGLSILL